LGPIAPTSRLRYKASVPYLDPEKRRAYGREWMKVNADKAREAMRRWRERHPEAHRAENAAYYVRHAERLKQRIAAYHRANPAVVRAKSQKHRALRLAAEGSFSPEQWTELVLAFGGRCAYCRKVAPLEPDHRVALSRGGSNRIANILPACRRCNARKHRMSESEFRARLAAEREQKPRYT
jgi:5-methylcytosine-specific restriction endonuclease McrA